MSSSSSTAASTASSSSSGASTVDSYVRSIMKVSIAQIAKDSGEFAGIRKSCLETLTDVMQRYIEEIGAGAASVANAAGRTECNFWDIKAALNDLNVDIGVLADFQNTGADLPFPKTLPRFPLRRPVVICDPPPPIASNDTTSTAATAASTMSSTANSMNVTDAVTSTATSSVASTAVSSSTSSSASSSNTATAVSTTAPASSASAPSLPLSSRKRRRELSVERRNAAHIPHFMPDFPDKRTYTSTPHYLSGVKDPKAISKQKVRENRLIQDSISRLQRTAAERTLPSTALSSSSATSSLDSLILPREYRAGELGTIGLTAAVTTAVNGTMTGAPLWPESSSSTTSALDVTTANVMDGLSAVPSTIVSTAVSSLPAKSTAKIIPPFPPPPLTAVMSTPVSSAATIKSTPVSTASISMMAVNDPTIRRLSMSDAMTDSSPAKH